MQITLRGSLLLMTMICITLALVGRPLSWLMCSEAFAAEFLNPFRHLSWIVYREPEYYDITVTQLPFSERTKGAIGMLLGAVISLVLHFGAIYLMFCGWVRAINSLKKEVKCESDA